ncbi:MAG: RagB/SusD family nutrient uptake outer membrane protein, partial [Butyricimonas faecihominis]
MNWRIIICVVGFLMGGCSLNIPLEDQFSDPDAITDVLSARSLLASAYEGLPQHLFEYSVLSDDFCPTQHLDRDATLKNLYDWREVEMTDLAGTLWTEYYMVVAEVNALLARMDGVITLNDTEVEEKERIICEAKGLKAWCYFDLLR